MPFAGGGQKAPYCLPVAGAERSFFVLPVTYVNGPAAQVLSQIYICQAVTDYE